MESKGLTYTFRTPDGWAFRLPPGSSFMIGRKGGGADILFSHPALSRRHSRWVNTSDACTIECLVNRWWVRVNGRSAPTTGITLEAGDLIELVPGLALIVDVETASDSARSSGTT
jgi:FHA domain